MEYDKIQQLLDSRTTGMTPAKKSGGQIPLFSSNGVELVRECLGKADIVAYYHYTPDYDGSREKYLETVNKPNRRWKFWKHAGMTHLTKSWHYLNSGYAFSNYEDEWSEGLDGIEGDWYEIPIDEEERILKEARITREWLLAGKITKSGVRKNWRFKEWDKRGYIAWKKINRNLTWTISHLI